MDLLKSIHKTDTPPPGWGKIKSPGRGARVAYLAVLERLCTRKGTKGSNPFLSANRYTGLTPMDIGGVVPGAPKDLAN